MQRQAKTFSTLHTALLTPRTSHFTHFTLHTSSHLKSCELFSPHLSSSHLIPSLLTCHLSKFLVSSSELFSSHPSTDQLVSSPRSSSQLIWAVLHARNLLLSERRLLKKKRLGAETFAHRSLRHRCICTDKPLHNILYYKAGTAVPRTTVYYKAGTKHVPVLLCTTKLAQSISQYYFVLQSLHKPLPSTTKLAHSTSQYYFVLQSLRKVLPSTTLYYKASCTTLFYKACTEYVLVLLCTTKLAQSTSQYYFVLQSLHRLRLSTTFYCKACTNYFPVLLCTTKLATSTSQYCFVLQSLHSTSQYYFVLQSLRKVRSSTTLYYKACTKHFPVLLCPTKLVQTTSQYYCVQQSLQKVLPSTTLYYIACTNYFPVLLKLLLCTTKLAKSTSQYYFVLQSLHKARSRIYYFL